MKIWTIEHKYKFVSFATESLAYKHIGKIIRDHLHEAFRAEDPLSTLGIRIIEQELIGHVME